MEVPPVADGLAVHIALQHRPQNGGPVFDRKGSIADGKDADIVVLDGENHVEQVFVKGRPCKPQARPRI